MTTLLGDVEQPTVDADEKVEVEITSDDRKGLTRRVFGVFVGVTAAGTVAAGGLLAAGSAASPPGVKTSFGSVRLTEAERQLRFLPSGQGGDEAGERPGTAHSGHEAVGATVQPANSTWGEHLALRLEVRNGSDRPVLFAPGQLRLQIGSDGPTVTNRDAEPVAGQLPAGTTTSLWISFLVPSDERRLTAKFTDPWGSGAPMTLELPQVLNRPGALEVDHV